MRTYLGTVLKGVYKLGGEADRLVTGSESAGLSGTNGCHEDMLRCKDMLRWCSGFFRLAGAHSWWC